MEQLMPETLINDVLYRPCVGIMLLNRDNKVFVGRRIDQDSKAWQMPQGGIDEHEESISAAKRELLEETGISNADLIAISDEWLYYDIPAHILNGHGLWLGKYKGQKQQWFLMRFTGPESEININTSTPEFLEWKWCNIEELEPNIVEFKRDIYRQVLDRFMPIISEAS
jgi:putative (di)nucleoside polyphosphate hydrolase